MMHSNKKRMSLAHAGMADGSENLKTFLRIRGMPGLDIYEDDYLQVEEECNVLLKNDYTDKAEKFNFDKVLQPETTQDECYCSTTAGLLTLALQGSKSCLFTYGASGSGKTYTIMGGSQKDAGMLPRAVNSLFQAVEKKIDASADFVTRDGFSVQKPRNGEALENRKIKASIIKASKFKSIRQRRSILNVDAALHDNAATFDSGVTTPDGKFVLFCSFVELYNEKAYDLLEVTMASKKRNELKVRSRSDGFYVESARHVRVDSANEALSLIKFGQKNLTVAETKLNHDSSRAHCIFSITIARSNGPENNPWESAVVSSLAFCDLAGVERRKKMGGLNAQRNTESKTINQSLLQLRTVVRELKEAQEKPGSNTVAFRNSKLTKLMQHYLIGGNAATSIIVAIGNDPQFREETKESLNFASTAKAVSLGTDKRGKRSSCGLSISKVCDAIPEEEEVSDEEYDDQMPTSQVPYMEWSKQELIGDLEYYIQEDKRLNDLVLRMKNEWKKDEYEFKLEQKEWEKERKDHWIDYRNICAEKDNRYNIMLDKFLKEKKELRRQIRELQAEKVSKSDDALATANDDTIEKMESEMKQISLDNAKLQSANIALEEAKEGLEIKLNRTKVELDSAKQSIDLLNTDLTDAKKKIDLELGRVEHLQSEYAHCHNVLREVEEEKKKLEEDLAEKELLPPPTFPRPKFDLTHDIVEQESDELLEATTESFLQQKTEAESKQKELEDRIELLEDELRKSQDQRSNLEGTISKGKAMLAEQKVKLENQLNIQVDQENKLEDRESTIVELKEALKEKAALINEQKDKIEEDQYELDMKRQQLQEKIDQITAIKSDVNRSEKKIAEMEQTYTDDVAAKVNEIKSLKHEMASLQEAFENSEELAESLREENNELRETLSAKVNTTIHQETEKRCFELVEDLDALSKEKHALCKQIKRLEKEKNILEISLKDANDRSETLEKILADEKQKFVTMTSKTTQNFNLQLQDQAEAAKLKEEQFVSQINQLQKEFASKISIQPQVQDTAAEVQKLESEVAALKGKLDRSLLRKQKEKALRQLEEATKKIVKLESLLAQREEDLDRMSRVTINDSGDTIHSKSRTTVKQEPIFEYEDQPIHTSPPPARNIVKEEPGLEPISENIVPTNLPQKATRGRRKKLAPSSPDPLDTPTQENIRPRRNLRSAKK